MDRKHVNDLIIQTEIITIFCESSKNGTLCEVFHKIALRSQFKIIYWVTKRLLWAFSCDKETPENVISFIFWSQITKTC